MNATETTAMEPKATGLSVREWSVILLLVVSVMINYVDRSNLALAAHPIQVQFGLTPVELGALLSAFSWTYALLQISGVTGWLTDRLPVGWVMAAGYALWCGATAVTGILSGYAALYVARLVLGAGESVAYPCYSRVFAAIPQAHRGRANAFIDAGTKLGPASGAFVGGLLLVHFGWRLLFVMLGAGGLLWLLPWIALMPKTGPSAEPIAAQSGASIWQIARVRSAWGACIGHFCGNYFFYFLLAWLPNYLAGEEKMALGPMSRLTSALFLVIAASTVAVGTLSDRLIAAGRSPTRVRKAAVVGGLGVASGLIAMVFVRHNLHISLVIMVIACVGYGAFASNHWAITQTLAGPVMAGRWSSVQNGVANLSGIAAPWIAGWVLQVNGSSRLAFVIAGAVAMAGALAWGLLVERVEPVNWDQIAAT